jgi:hypothetical protein
MVDQTQAIVSETTVDVWWTRRGLSDAAAADCDHGRLTRFIAEPR